MMASNLTAAKALLDKLLRVLANHDIEMKIGKTVRIYARGDTEIELL